MPEPVPFSSPANAQKNRRGLSRIWHAAGYSLAGLRVGWNETAFRQEALASLVLVPAAAQATVIADWQMDEPEGATVMVDSAGNLNGEIWSVVTGVAGLAHLLVTSLQLLDALPHDLELQTPAA